MLRLRKLGQITKKWHNNPAGGDCVPAWRCEPGFPLSRHCGSIGVVPSGQGRARSPSAGALERGGQQCN